MSSIRITISYDEIWPLLNVLNEICHGFFIPKFKEKIGATKVDVMKLFKKIQSNKPMINETNKPIQLSLDAQDLIIINNAFDQTLEEIEDWELRIRVGISAEEALSLKRKIIGG